MSKKELDAAQKAAEKNTRHVDRNKLKTLCEQQLKELKGEKKCAG